MNRLTLALLIGLLSIVSVSANAGNRDGHYGKNHRHCNKHHRHHARQQRHVYARGHRCHRCWNDDHYRHVRHIRPYVVPGYEFGVFYGGSGLETVIVYQQRGVRW